MEDNTYLLVVGDFVLNTNSRKLYDRENKEVSLSPTLYTLLKYFIDNQNVILSRDDIISNVWKDKIVVDANVNQNIKKLRDTLGDSASAPLFIETVKGEGFRFIANSEAYRATPNNESSLPSPKNYLAIIASIVIIILGALYFLSNQNEKSLLKEIYPLTTIKGIQNYPAISSDHKYLLFNHKQSGSWDIYLKPLESESYHPILNSKDDELFPQVSPNNKKLIYYVSGANKCGLFIRDIRFDELSVGPESIVKKCKNGTERYRASWINESEIFFSFNEDLVSPASIYRYNLLTKQQVLISKPDSKGFGDYITHYSREKNKLAYIRNIAWASSEIWIYDLESKSHKKIKDSPFLFSGIDFDSEGWIYFQSGNRELSRIKVDGGNEEVVAKFQSNFYVPFVIDKGRLGVMIGSLSVIDVAALELASGDKRSVVSSRFSDYLADGGKGFIVFVSNRTGRPQVWLKTHQGEEKQLTYFSDSYELRWLSVSEDGGLIMFNRGGSTIIINQDGEVQFNSENYSFQAHNNSVFDIESDRFLYSIQYEGEWNIEVRKLSSPTDRYSLFKGVSARPCKKSGCIYYFKENDPFLYEYESKSNSSIKIAKIAKIRRADEWDVYDEENILYLKSGKKQNEIVKKNLVSGEEITIFKLKAKTFSYDSEKDIIYFNVVSQGATELAYFQR